MRGRLTTAKALLFAALPALCAGSSVNAQSPAEFYKGRTVIILVGIEQGTGFDLYGRTLSRHIGRHIPGNPTVIVNNMPGASGLVAFNWMANVAPRDGSLFGTVSFSVPFEPMFGNTRALFDATKFHWIGNMDRSVSVCAVRTDAGIDRFQDMLEKEVLIGGTGSAGPISQSPTALKNLTGAKIKLIEGYKGTATVKLAVERKEVQGICGVSFSTIRTQWRQLMDRKEVRLMIHFGAQAPDHPMLKGVPSVFDFAKTPEQRQVYDLVFGPQGLGRSFSAPPGVPADRVAALREAFTKTMNDPALIAEAEKTDLDIAPQTGAEVQAFIERAYASPPDIVAKAKRALEY